MRRARARCGCAALLLVTAVGGSPLGADGLRPEDNVTILALERRVLAVSPATGPVAEVNLEPGERILSTRSSGRLGVATTSRRLLGIRAGSATWLELRYRLSEDPGTEDLHVRERVALARLPGRIAGLTPASAMWQELVLGPGEQVREMRTSSNLGLVVTNRRAVALGRSGFVEQALTPRERVERSSIDDHSAALVTSHRVLIFQSGALGWSQVRK